MKVKPPAWKGRTIVCIASGPSLTMEDCDLVRQSGLPVIVTNTTFRLCPWADALFAFDVKWWAEYHEEVHRIFGGLKYTYSNAAIKYGAQSVINEGWFQSFSNSGACAIALGIASGASKIILLGYDCQKTNGKTHWHGDHPEHLSNAATLKKWPAQFSNVGIAAKIKAVQIINASRETALTCFERARLEDVL